MDSIKVVSTGIFREKPLLLPKTLINLGGLICIADV